MITDTTNKLLDYVNETPIVDGEFNEQGVLNIALSFFDLFRGLYVETSDTSIVSGKKYYTYSNGTYTLVANPSASSLNTYYEESKEKEVVLFKQYFEVAKIYCSRMSDWSFLIKSQKFEEDDIYNVDEIDEKDLDSYNNGYYIEKTTENGVVTYKAYSMYKDFKYAFKLPSDFLKMKYINGKQNMGFAVKGNIFYCNSTCPTLDYVSTTSSNYPIDYGYLVAYRLAVELSQHIDPNGDAATKASSLFQATFTTLQSNDSFNFRIQNPEETYYLSQYSKYWKGKGVLAR